MHTYVILHNIRSAYNVGSIFRTAESAGVARIFLTGYTPTPTDRFGRARGDLAKVALGAERMVSWERHVRLAPLLGRLKSEGVALVAVEQAPQAQDYRSFRVCGPTVFIFGNEVRGLSTSALALADTVLEIPMRGRKESLNVAVAAGVVLFSCMERVEGGK
ncbi:MAG: TrmH family RNA methyltransferase [bacterium]|nr:TrmH family RNA methyltransferase [bacterium]MDZ4284419.1 TrmH family RNA methyltransferase [Patescibacteria group bacterium]